MDRGAAGGGPVSGREGLRDALWFFALACAITWALDAAMVLAWLRGEPPDGLAMGLGGLGAFGPMLAAFVLARRRGELGQVFGRWRTGGPLWILIALVTPFVLHLIATLIEVALGGSPARWFYPPGAPEQWTALVVFSVAEEFGWRGYAYPRLARWQGPVNAAVMVGAVWGLWHLGMMFVPDRPAPTAGLMLTTMATLALTSVVMAWSFERGGRSMAVAIAFHVGLHLDNPDRAPEGEVRLQALRFVVLLVAAVLAARALARRPGGRTA